MRIPQVDYNQLFSITCMPEPLFSFLLISELIIEVKPIVNKSSRKTPEALDKV